MRSDALIAALLSLAGCGRTAQLPLRPLLHSPLPTDSRESQVDPCAEKPTPESLPRHWIAGITPSDGERIAEVRVRGARTVPEDLITREMKSKPGAPFSSRVAQLDVAAISALGVFEDVHLVNLRRDSELVLVVEVSERPLLRNVSYALGSTQPTPGDWVAPLPGDLYDSKEVQRAARALERGWIAQGYWDAEAKVQSTRVDEDRVDVCLKFSRGALWRLEKISLPGASPATAAELLGQMDTHKAQANVPGRPFRPDLLEVDYRRFSTILHDKGLLFSSLGKPRVVRDPTRHTLTVEIPVHEGRVFRIGRTVIAGNLAGPKQDYEKLLEVTPGEVFARSRVMDGIDRVRKYHGKLAGKGDKAQVELLSDLVEGEGIVHLVLQIGVE